MLTGRERHQAGIDMRHVLSPTEAVELSYPASNRAIPEQDDTPSLPVAPARREPRMVEDAVYYRIRYRLVGKGPGRRRRPHHLVKLHNRSTYRPIFRPGPVRHRY